MRHALASVALLALVTGCDSPPPSEDPVGPILTATETPNTAVTITAGASSANGPSGSTGFGNAGTITGGQSASSSSSSSSGSGGSAGESGSDGENGFAGEAGAPNYLENPYPALAMTRAQREVLLDEQNSSGGESTTSSVPIDPDELWVVIADTALACNEYPPLPECGGHWQINLMLTQAMQHVGTYDLAEGWFGVAWAENADAPDTPDECGKGFGGGVGRGTIELLEINAREIRFRLHADPLLLDRDVDGIFTIPLCP